MRGLPATGVSIPGLALALALALSGTNHATVLKAPSNGADVLASVASITGRLVHRGKPEDALGKIIGVWKPRAFLRESHDQAGV